MLLPQRLTRKGDKLTRGQYRSKSRIRLSDQFFNHFAAELAKLFKSAGVVVR